jgi:hypothetical protein
MSRAEGVLDSFELNEGATKLLIEAALTGQSRRAYETGDRRIGCGQ